MIQINLLPEVKQLYLRSQQTKHTVIVTAILVSIVTLILLILMFVYVQFIQSMHRDNLQKDIDSSVHQLKRKKNAVKIVTVQGALEQLPEIQNKKVLASSLFEYLKSFTPRDVGYDTVTLDVVNNSLTLQGGANSTEKANILANNLKSAKFSFTKENETQVVNTPINNILFNDLSKAEQSQQGRAVTFNIVFTFDPLLFSQGISNKKLTVNAASEELLLPTATPFISNPSGGAQ
jgi:Tfp pilus assembly protein PilN